MRHQKDLNSNGYTILNFLDDEKFKSLVQLYEIIKGNETTAGTNKNTYELSFFEKNVQSKKDKFNAMYNFLKPVIDEVLNDYIPIMVNLFNKEKGLGEVPIHQNWTFVDEDIYTSVSLWIPLQDVNRENGTLEIVPGSQKVVCKYRGPSIPWVFDELNDLLKKKYMVPIEIKRGQAVILDDSVIHYSGLNNIDIPRRAIQVILKPRESQLIHCYQNDKNLIEILDVEDDYFFDFNMWEKPKEGLRKKIKEIYLPKLNEDQLTKLCFQNICSNL
jgi:hypothetical protein